MQPPEKMKNSKNNTLSLNSKIELIKCYEESKVSVKKLVVQFKCGKTQVYEILKNKDKIKDDWLNNGRSNDSKRKLRITGNEEINAIVYDWFLDARSRNLPISGPLLQAQAKLVAEKLNMPDFKASNGWLESFRTRHEITFGQINGEANDVDMTVIEDWKLKIQSLIAEFQPENIANCDETGLFFRALPNKTLKLKGEKCIGGKQSKERLTVLMCGFADGKLEKPLVIGKARKPRCFKNVKVSDLPVVWRYNRKAWMTSEIMTEWLKSLNQKMKNKKRHILLFLDNATCHPRLNLSNIQLCFFTS